MPTLLELFPDGKFIHMMRDPRDVLASTKSARTRTEGRHVWRPESLVSVWVGAAVLKSWRDCAHLHHRYQQDYPHNYIMFRFEDLIADPQAWVPKLCEFVDIGFVQDMFSPEVVNSSFVSRAAHVQGFDSAALERWREHLHPLFDRWYGAVLRRELLEFGYT